MKPLNTILFSFFLVFQLPAQTGLLKKAEKMMAELDFQGAIQLLENSKVKRTSSRRSALLGECYRRSGYFEEAEKRFRQVEDWSDVRPTYMLHFARTLQRAEKYPEALAYYQRYLGSVPSDPLAREQAAACRDIQALQSRGTGWWEAQPLGINSEYREFSPAIYERGLVFCSDRPVEGLANYQDAWTGEGFLDLFLCSRKTLDATLCGSYTYSPPEVFNEALSSRFHEASAHFSADFEEVFFTGNAPGNGKGRDDAGLLRLGIHHARRLPGNKGWTDPIPLSINSGEYSVMHPCLSRDGRRLYFSSDMPGGHGGLDLYYADRVNGVWGPPFNLGPDINTQGSEVFPYFSLDGLLYFSSDGWAGLGGLDIFFSREEKIGIWAAPYNPGAPINSSSDDFGFIWEETGTCGYFSSDRRGGAGKDDLFSFRKIAHPIDLEIQDAETRAYLGGGFLTAACRPDTLRVIDGRARWEIPHNACCELLVQIPHYLPGLAIRCTYNLPPGEPIQLLISLTPNPVYTLEGVVFQESTGLPLEDVEVQIFDRDTGRMTATYLTNFSGRFEVEVAPGACYEIKALKNGYVQAYAIGPCVAIGGKSRSYQLKVYMER